MEQLTITEANEIIAEYMEFIFIPVKAGFEHKSSYNFIDKEFTSRQECLKYCDEINVWMDPESCFYPQPKCENFELKYHSSWDWLMPVVEKIESLKLNGHRYYVEIRHESCEISVAINKGANTNKIYSSLWQNHSSKIDAVYNAVVQFIKWYNENNKTA